MEVMRVELRFSQPSREYPCLTCGTWFQSTSLIGVLKDSQGYDFGYLCDTCLAASPDELQQALHDHAEGLRAFAAELETFAHQPLALPSQADVSAARFIAENEVWIVEETD